MNPVHTTLAYVVWFLATYYLVFFILILCTHEDELLERRRWKGARVRVSIIVPAFNEQGKIAQTIASLKKVSWKDIEYIIVNDGSKDNTAAEVRAAIRGDSRFRFIDRVQNKGKAASLNEGIAVANGEFIATIDADTVVERDIIQKVLPYFDAERIGAVTVTVQVRKPKRYLHKLLQIEYIIGLSLFLRLLSFADLIFVTPGPFSIYRKSVLKKIKGFDAKSITEDLEIAYRIRMAGYTITHCMDAKVQTILPETFKGLYVQRKRWYTGALLTVFQHRKALLSRRLGMFSGFILFNYALTLMGIVLFLSSIWLTVTKFGSEMVQYRYTHFNYFANFWHGIREYQFDVLSWSGIDLLGITAVTFTFLLVFLGLLATRTQFRGKKLAILGYPLLFFLYQLWWIVSFTAAIRGKKIKWR